MIPKVYYCIFNLGKSELTRYVVASSRSNAECIIANYYATLFPHLSFVLLDIKPLRSISRQSIILKQFINGTVN